MWNVFSKDVSQIKKEYENKIQEIKRKHRNEIENREALHAGAIRSLTENHANEMMMANDTHRDEQRELRGSLQSLQAQLEWEMNQARGAMGRMTEKHQYDVENLKRAHDADKTELVQTQRRDTEQLVSKYNQDIEQLISKHDQDTGRLIDDYDHQIQVLNTTIQRLQNEIQDINGALLTRDDEFYQGKIFTASGLPSNPDEKIKNQFREIQQMVEELGRLTWKTDQRLWTDRIFERIPGHTNSRALRKNILVDLIWTLLFHYVFYSPFRIFGEEGRTLETEWAMSCGPEGTAEQVSWPTPSAAAERWRYMTIKECREALERRLSEIDPRARAKKGFVTSQKNLITAVKTELGDISELTAGDLQLIQRLSRKAAITWLELSMHRCRIVVRLTGSDVETTQEKIALLKSGSLTLTIAPEVGRRGNVDGVELDRWTVIAGCTGDSSTIP